MSGSLRDAIGAVLTVGCTSTLVAQLTYVDSSAGLQTPRMEGGRTELELADLNLDGHPDIVSIGDHGSPNINSEQHGVMVWFGDGTGSWSVFQTGNFGYGGIAVGDVNGDGLPDVGYGMHHDYSATDLGDQLLEVALGDGTGRNWTPYDDGLATNGETWGMFGTDFADVDNDGDLDVGAISFGCCAGLHIYLNQGDGSWVQSFGFLGGNSNQEFVFGDVNGDGLTDLAASHGNGTVYLGDGVGGFSLVDGNLPAPIWRRGVSLGDVNDDGRDELSFATSAGGLAVYTWAGAGSWQSFFGTLPASGTFRATQIADMDLDGHGDLVAFSNSQIVVYGGDGAGGWAAIASIATQPNTCAFSALRAGVDIDHNGYPDIAVVAEENCQPFVGGRNRPRLYREASTPSAAFVYPKIPRGGETFVAGSVRFIEWHAAVPGGGPSAMTIELSLQGPAGPWTTLAQDPPNNGRFQWHLAPTLPASRNAFLRFRLSTAGGDALAVTPRAFAIVCAGGTLPGDLDGDADVDLQDLGILLADFGCTGGGCPGDADGDGDTDLADLGIVLSAFGRTC